jgi:hypothetical protein
LSSGAAGSQFGKFNAKRDTKDVRSFLSTMGNITDIGIKGNNAEESKFWDANANADLFRRESKDFQNQPIKKVIQPNQP